MGLKGYRLWVMGQLDSNVQSLAVGWRLSAPSAATVSVMLVAPFEAAASSAASAPPWPSVPRCSAAGCVFERQTLKLVFSLDRL
jgi:hypothetical protein